MILGTLGRMLGFQAYKDKTSALVLTVQHGVYKIFLVILTFTAILWMSIFLYASFYYTYVPAISHVYPVHLQYRSCGKTSGLCSYPSAEVSLTQKHRLLMVGQPYKLAVELELPDSPQNQAAGMFMVCSEMRTQWKIGIQRSCRSAILHYRSFLHNLIHTFLYFPFLLSGSAQEKQLIYVELFSGFVETAEDPAVETLVEIESQHIQIYKATLKIHAHFRGLRYFMFHWPLLASLVGISTNFFFISVVTILSWWKIFNGNNTILHIGYDANAAKYVEERESITSKERLAKKKRKLRHEDEILDEDLYIDHVPSTTDTDIKKREMSKRLDGKDKLEEMGSESPLRSGKVKREVLSEERKESTSDEFEVLNKSTDMSDSEGFKENDEESEKGGANKENVSLESSTSSSSDPNGKGKEEEEAGRSTDDDDENIPNPDMTLRLRKRLE